LPGVGKIIKGFFGVILIIVGIAILLFAVGIVINGTSGNVTNGIYVIIAVFVALFGLAFIGVGAKFV
jgi:ABC-type transport system involved in multi-copper enzyme maturation permease subunit